MPGRPPPRCPRSGKQSWWREADALGYLARVLHRWHDSDRPHPIRAYRCEVCKRWHVTSKPLRRNPE
ncbi:hypothetical protein DAETH_28680 [Deinococcus aetherius]|uniref:Uncharacterized protein n=1 Tax=Deinococcus aetherius TaxID=200252 RepID=A0ABM8AGH0_9DEIO|nr:hypothetical protein [Deinococcus aetherius]BDP42899.1 hypothetical protein DAETH_28680 [Deinococcus aetherius]